MEELHFNCPAYLAQRFWLHCSEQKETPGSVLRQFMIEQIVAQDASFLYDLKEYGGFDGWSIREGKLGR